VYIDIEPNDNLDEPVIATFNQTGPGKPIVAVKLELNDGWHWCAVTGWNEGPAPALFTPIEESGDGPAKLVSGDQQGLRLARISDPTQAKNVVWSLADSAQWAEPFLICLPQVEVAAGE
jgi:hypothetical protein